MTNKAIIVGAGVSGLTAANILSQQGYNVTVLEKNSKAGGRLANHTFADDSKAELGATFIHDTSHPVIKLFPTGGTRYNLENSYFAELQRGINNFLLSKKEAVYNLSFRQLLTKIANISDDDSSDLQEIAECFSSEPLASIINLNDGIENAVGLLQVLGIDVDQESIIGSQYYLGAENGEYIPNEGYSKVTDYLLHKATFNGVEIEYGVSVTEVNSEHNVILQNGTEIAADMVVIAIAPYQYDNIEFNPSDAQEAGLEAALNKLAASGRSKIAINLSQPLKDTVNDHVDLSAYQAVNEDGSVSDYNGFGYNIFGNKNSNILYVLYQGDKFSTDQAIAGLDHVLSNLKSQGHIAEDTEITETKTSYNDGNSWYSQTVGFMPVNNSGNVKFLGAVTGSDDSVHSCISAACDILTDDMEQCLGDLFAQAETF